MKNQIIISTLNQLKAISAPLRLKLFEDIREANQQGKLQPIRELAKNLDMSHAKLYYHGKQLEKHGFIQVAHIEFVSGIAEKHYEVVGHSITIDQTLLPTLPHQETADAYLSTLRSALEVTIADVTELLQTEPTGEQTIHFNRQLLRLTKEQTAVFHSKIKALEAEMKTVSNANGNEGDVYSLTAVFTPTVRKSSDHEERDE